MSASRFRLADRSNDEPLAMQNLTEAQQDQLGRLLECYLEAIETGLPPTVEMLTRDCPELREALATCVQGLESLHQLAGGGLTTHPTQPNDDDTQHRLGDFDLHEEIGRGGMGVVYRATQRSLHRTVAVKVLPLASVLDPRQLTRFQHEAEAAASLQHPSIVPVFAVGCERGVHFYAMRFVAGASLADWIDDHSSTDWNEAVSMIANVADGLHAAHEFGIVHRDVKPSNLLLDPSGKVWITDFGLARIQTDHSVTQSGDVVGTTRYMSPEQARGESAIVDGRSDVYSLAATLYEMLTLQPAHEGDDVPAILRGIDESSITPMKKWRLDLPRDLETVVAKAMSGKRDDRYDTAKEFADDLRRVLADEPTLARPPTVVDRAVRMATKHRHAVFATCLVGFIAVIGFAIATAKLATAKQLSDSHAAQSFRNELIARDAIDRLGIQMSELLSDIPAANSVRHQLLRETLDYYQQFASAPSTDGTAVRRRSEDLALTFGKMGVLQSELGDHPAAIESLRASESQFEKLASERLQDSSLRLNWTISQNNLAEELAKSGDFEAASDWFTRAIENQRQMHHHGNAAASLELAKTLNNLGGMLAETENTAASKVAYTQAIEMLADPLTESDAMESHADLRATFQSNLAGVLAAQEPAAAAKLARKSLVHQLQQLDLNASDPQIASQVVVTLNTLAKTQSQTGDHASAVETLRQSVDIVRQLHARWPTQLTYRRDLVITLNALGISLSDLGRLEQADAVVQQAARHGRQLNESLVDNAEIQSMLGGVLNNLGFLHQRLGEKTFALQCYQEAVQHQRRAVSLKPDVRRYQALLQTHRVNLRRLESKS